MTSILRLLITVALAACGLLATAAPSMAIVGGNAASAGEYPSIARVTFGSGFLCTGTLIAPNWVLTAGHCNSLTGAAVASPVGWPAALINVRIGGHTASTGEQVPVRRTIAHPNYLLGAGYDVALLELQRNSTKASTQVAGASERALWDPGDLETIVGWGATEEGGSTPSTLQEGQVPITTDAYCAGAYGDFDAATMVCAGFPEGGVDTCQGDSGGPMFGRTGAGALRVVGATSFGEGCARPERPGVYARVADTTLRTWIRGHVPAGVAGS